MKDNRNIGVHHSGSEVAVFNYNWVGQKKSFVRAGFCQSD